MRLRIQITKEEGIRFIAHLEYVRTLERALRRAKLPVAYSEGFNPHMKFSLASALGVGVTSDSEFVEIELAKEVDINEAMEAFSRALPWGIHVKAADIVDSKKPKLMASAAGATYRIVVPCEGEAIDAVNAFNAAKNIIFQKPAPKSRSKVKEIDVKEFVKSIKGEMKDNNLVLNFDCKITPLGSMKASEIVKVLKENFAAPLVLEKADIKRTDLFGKNPKGKKCKLLNNDYIAK